MARNLPSMDDEKICALSSRSTGPPTEMSSSNDSSYRMTGGEDTTTATAKTKKTTTTARSRLRMHDRGSDVTRPDTMSQERSLHMPTRGAATNQFFAATAPNFEKSHDTLNKWQDRGIRGNHTITSSTPSGGTKLTLARHGSISDGSVRPVRREVESTTLELRGNDHELPSNHGISKSKERSKASARRLARAPSIERVPEPTMATTRSKKRGASSTAHDNDALQPGYNEEKSLQSSEVTILAANLRTSPPPLQHHHQQQQQERGGDDYAAQPGAYRVQGARGGSDRDALVDRMERQPPQGGRNENRLLSAHVVDPLAEQMQLQRNVQQLVDDRLAQQGIGHSGDPFETAVVGDNNNNSSNNNNNNNKACCTVCGIDFSRRSRQLALLLLVLVLAVIVSLLATLLDLRPRIEVSVGATVSFAHH